MNTSYSAVWDISIKISGKNKSLQPGFKSSQSCSGVCSRYLTTPLTKVSHSSTPSLPVTRSFDTFLTFLYSFHPSWIPRQHMFLFHCHPNPSLTFKPLFPVFLPEGVSLPHTYFSSIVKLLMFRWGSHIMEMTRNCWWWLGMACNRNISGLTGVIWPNLQKGTQDKFLKVVLICL